jgi:hydroxymethylpyrimidine pyrophosphatase-like HAD family hydrolase
MTIAVDFDGTIVEHAYPKIGKPIPFAFEVLQKLQQEENHKLILWTIREGRLLQEAVDFCEENGVYFYACNTNYTEEEFNENIPRKIGADIFIDDRNIGGLLDWRMVYKIIKTGSNTIQDIERIEHTFYAEIKKNWMIRFGEAWEKAKEKRS